MGIILYILFLIFCIFAGFNGMPYMFIFPIVTIIGVIVLWNTSGNSNNTQDYSKTDNNSSKNNDAPEDFILFNMFFNNKK